MSDDNATTDNAHADIGLVCSLAIELRPLLEKCGHVRKYTGGKFTFRGGKYDGVKLAVVEAGLGYARARRATQALIEAHTPPFVLSVGFSGGLTDATHLGHIVIANSICDTHGNSLEVDVSMPANPDKGLHVGRFVTADEMVRTVDEKTALAEKHEAIAVDMESLAVAQVCQETGTRFLAVRVISDDLAGDLPPEVLTVMGSSGSVRIGATIGALWKRPGSIKDMWRLREQANTAAERLAIFLDGVLLQLHQSLS